MKIKLSGVMETLLLTLGARYRDAVSENPILGDRKALEIAEQIEYNFNCFDYAWKSYYGILSRGKLMDTYAKNFIKEYPTAVIVSLGCGLDSRFFRIDNGQICWYNVDFPEVISLREQLFEPHERVIDIGQSILDEAWVKEINRSNRKLLFLVEGVLMYFTEEEVKHFLEILVNSFDDFEAHFDCCHKIFINKAKYHDTLKKMNAPIRWGVTNGKEILALAPQLKQKECINLTTEMAKHINGMRRLLLPVIYFINNRLCIYEYKKI